MQKPLVSVLLPVYNCENYVLEAVESILLQTYSHFELLIIDDCSTDATVEKIKTLTDQRIQLIEKPKNSGYTNSLNFGLTIAKGKYIARMDGDDISLPLRFEKQVAFLEANEDVVLCGTAFELIHNNCYVAVPENHSQIKLGMLEECKVGHPTIMMRTSFLKEHEFFYDSKMEPAEDYDLWVRMIQFGYFHNLQEPLLKYRVHQNQVSNQRNFLQNQNALQIKCNLFFSLDKHSSDKEIEAYKNIMSDFNHTSFSDFLIFLKLKEKMIYSNDNLRYFDKNLFEIFLSTKEEKFMNFYFKNRASFSWEIFGDYIKVFNKTSSKIGHVQFLKLFLKCVIFYKVK